MSSQGSKLKLEPNGRVMGKSWLNMASRSILVQIFVDIIVTKNCLLFRNISTKVWIIKVRKTKNVKIGWECPTVKGSAP